METYGKSVGLPYFLPVSMSQRAESSDSKIMLAYCNASTSDL